VKLQPHHAAFLDRTARRLSARVGRAVSRDEVLGALLDIAVQDEGVYDPDAPERPLSPLRRGVLQEERGTRTCQLGERALTLALREEE